MRLGHSMDYLKTNCKPKIMTTDLYDTKSAADFLGLSVDQLRRRVRASIITPTFRSRNTFLWDKKDLLTAHESLTVS